MLEIYPLIYKVLERIIHHAYDNANQVSHIFVNLQRRAM